MATRLDLRLLALFGAGLAAQGTPAFAGEWTITPTIALHETATDNVRQSDNKKGDLITDITPGINILGNGDRVKLRFDYQMHNLIYANESWRNNTQNSLNAQGTLEALEKWFYIDAAATISQQNLSAFGGATNSSVDVNNSSNTTETSNYRLSPYFRGYLGNFANYELRYNFNRTTASAGRNYDTDVNELVGKLKGTTQFSMLTWGIDASTRKADFSNGRHNEADLLRGILTYHIDPQFAVSLIGGTESNDYVSIEKKSHTLKGAGLEWAPTERTQVSASRESRFFGNSDNLSFTHRTQGTAWKFKQTKDAVTSSDQMSLSAGTYYDLFYSMLASAMPDPVQRAATVNALLQTLGLSPNAQLQGGFLTTGVTLQKRRELSFALNGVRNTVTFAATRSETESLSQGAGLGMYVGVDFANVNNIMQQGASVNWSHKLTGLSTLTGSLSRLKSEGRGGSTIDSDQKMLTVNFVTKLGPHTTAGLGARHTRVDGTTNYTENAVTGTFSHQF